jgi:hypothetical protein
MKTRCNNPNLKQFKDYGGRGISYDPRWASFANFLADMGEPLDELTLDRINNDGNYSKENCRWADRATQARNGRRTIMVTDQDGNTECIKDMAKRHGIVYGTLYSRLKQGRPLIT